MASESKEVLSTLPPGGAWVVESRRLGARLTSECRTNGLYISPLFGAFVIRMLAVQQGVVPEAAAADADAGEGDNGPLLSLQVEKQLLEAAMERVQADEDPIVGTWRMQVAFEKAFHSELRQLRSRRVRHEVETQRLLKKVSAAYAVLENQEHVAALYRALFKLLLHTARVDQVDRAVQREVAAGLDSVFPSSALTSFNMISDKEKRAQIESLVPTVLGIRLFNKELGKGGARLRNAAAQATQRATALMEELDEVSSFLKGLLQTYSDLITLEFERPGTISSSLVALQQELTNRRQLMLLVHQLAQETGASFDTIRLADRDYKDSVSELRDVVGNRTAVPKEDVYPVFHRLATAYVRLCEEEERVSVYRSVYEEIRNFQTDFETSLTDEDIELSAQEARHTKLHEAKHAPEFSSFVETSTDREPSQSPPDVPVRLEHHGTAAFMELPLQYQGYCAVNVVKRGGLVLPGDPSLGIVRYLDKYYSFATVRDMAEFCEDPERFVSGMDEAVREHTELIHLLRMQRDVPHADIRPLIESEEELADISELFDGGAGGRGGGVSRTKVDQGVQTPTHFTDKHIDPSYEWNEWSLRRKALQLANLTNKRTTSVQTAQSHFRRDAEVQSYVQAQNPDGTMPGQGTQTGISKGTNVARTSRYVQGLRGDTGPTKMKVVTLTLEPTVTDGTNSALRPPPPSSSQQND